MRWVRQGEGADKADRGGFLGAGRALSVLSVQMLEEAAAETVPSCDSTWKRAKTCKSDCNSPTVRHTVVKN